MGVRRKLLVLTPILLSIYIASVIATIWPASEVTTSPLVVSVKASKPTANLIVLIDWCYGTTDEEIRTKKSTIREESPGILDSLVGVLSDDYDLRLHYAFYEIRFSESLKVSMLQDFIHPIAPNCGADVGLTWQDVVAALRSRTLAIGKRTGYSLTTIAPALGFERISREPRFVPAAATFIVTVSDDEPNAPANKNEWKQFRKTHSPALKYVTELSEAAAIKNRFEQLFELKELGDPWIKIPVFVEGIWEGIAYSVYRIIPKAAGNCDEFTGIQEHTTVDDLPPGKVKLYHTVQPDWDSLKAKGFRPLFATWTAYSDDQYLGSTTLGFVEPSDSGESPDAECEIELDRSAIEDCSLVVDVVMSYQEDKAFTTFQHSIRSTFPVEYHKASFFPGFTVEGQLLAFLDDVGISASSVKWPLAVVFVLMWIGVLGVIFWPPPARVTIDLKSPNND